MNRLGLAMDTALLVYGIGLVTGLSAGGYWDPGAVYATLAGVSLGVGGTSLGRSIVQWGESA